MMLRDSLEGFAVGAFLTGLVYAIGYYNGWMSVYPTEPNLMQALEISGVFLNFACVWLVVRQKMANWWIGIVASTLLGVFFYKLNLLASATLSLAYFVPIQLWGWWNWKFNGVDNRDMKVSTMNLAEWVVVGMLGTFSWYATTELFTYFGAALAPMDTGILVLSIIAQYLLGWKKLESWGFWFAVNILSIYVYGTMGAYLVSAQYLLFLLNASNGAYQWYDDLLEQAERKVVKFGRG